MRRLSLLLLTACTLFATVASAVEPVQHQVPPLDAAAPQVPLSTDLPSNVTNELPDMGSPEAAIISHSDERQLGYMIVQELRDQNALIDDPETRRRLEGAGCEVHTYPGSEISVKGEGGPTCLTLPLLRSP